MTIAQKFLVNIELKFGSKSNIKTLFHDDWRYFTIPSKVHKDWRNEEGEGKYAFLIDPNLLEAYKNNIEIYRILESIEKDCKDSYMQISANKGRCSLDGEKQLKFEHYRCNVSILLLRKLKLLFISSYVYNSAKEKLPNNFNESMELEFDVKQKTVFLRSINIYHTR